MWASQFGNLDINISEIPSWNIHNYTCLSVLKSEFQGHKMLLMLILLMIGEEKVIDLRTEPLSHTLYKEAMTPNSLISFKCLIEGRAKFLASFDTPQIKCFTSRPEWNKRPCKCLIEATYNFLSVSSVQHRGQWQTDLFSASHIIQLKSQYSINRLVRYRIRREIG